MNNLPSVLWRCWLGGRKGIRPVKTEWRGAGVVICLERGADLHMPSWCHCHSLSIASVKSRLVLPFWYRLTWVVPEKGPLNGCVCVCVCWWWSCSVDQVGQNAHLRRCRRRGRSVTSRWGRSDSRWRGEVHRRPTAPSASHRDEVSADCHQPCRRGSTPTHRPRHTAPDPVPAYTQLPVNVNVNSSFIYIHLNYRLACQQTNNKKNRK